MLLVTAVDVDLLVGAESLEPIWNVSGDDDDRGPVERGVADRSDRVQHSRTEGGQHNSRPVRHPEVGVGRVGRDLLVVTADEPDAAADQPVEDREIPVTAHAEHHVRAEPAKGLGNYVSASHRRHVRTPVAWFFRRVAISISTASAVSSVFVMSSSEWAPEMNQHPVGWGANITPPSTMPRQKSR